MALKVEEPQAVRNAAFPLRWVGAPHENYNSSLNIGMPHFGSIRTLTGDNDDERRSDSMHFYVFSRFIRGDEQQRIPQCE
jgi:hypothetical protein